MAQRTTLTAKRVARALKRPGRYRDREVRGLLLVVGKWDKKERKYVAGDQNASWQLRYQLNKRERIMGLGSVRDFSLSEARERAKKWRQQLADDVDPLEAKAATEAAAVLASAKAIPFESAARDFHKQHSPKWKNVKHAKQFISTLESYVFPVIGRLSVASIDTGLVLKCLEPIWTTVPETASRVRGRIEAVLDWCTARQYRTGDNPARWRGHLVHVLPKRKTNGEHFPALPYAQIPEFMADLRTREGVAAKALEFAILTCARTGEVIGAQHNEFDLKTKLWTVPEGRTKGEKQHKVPLSDRAIKILKGLPLEKNNPFTFIGAEGVGLSNMSLLAVIKRMNEARAKAGLPFYIDPDQDNRPVTPHGTARSTFRDWAGDCTAFERQVIEFALAHGLTDKTEEAYRRATAIEKRRRLMAAWATYCGTKPSAKGDVVVPLQGRR